MPDAAGSVNIVLSVNKANFSAAMADAQRQLDAFAGKSKAAGHATVSSMQASSAAIRELRDPLGNNQRAVERFLTTIPGVGNALRAAFPLIGGAAFAAMIIDMGVKVVDFVKKANAMPQTIRDGFAALNLSQKTSIDSTIVLTDKLNDAHAAFEHKPSDALKLGIDEARESADRFAASIVEANSKVEELLSKNHLNGFASFVMGKPLTGDVENDFKAFQNKQSTNSFDLANAAPGSDAAKAAQQAISDTLSGFIADQQRKLPFRQAQGGSVAADSEGILTNLLGQQRANGADTDHAAAEGQAAKDEAVKKAAEQAKAAAAKQVQAMVEGLNAVKLQQTMSVKSEYEYWDARRNAFATGSDAYNQIVAKQAELAVAGARSAHEAIAKFNETQKRDSSEQAPLDPMRAANEWIKQQAAERQQSYIDANQSSIDDSHNRAKDQEAGISEQAGHSLSRFAAALDIAKVHTDDFKTTFDGLTSILAIRAAAAKNDPTVENQRALAAATKALNDTLSQRGIQVGKDNIAVYGAPSSALVGAQDAIQDFVLASRDAATQMRDLVTSTLHGLNDQLVQGMMGKRTDFKGFGSSVFKSVATTSLQRGEGALMGAMGLGKLGTKSNPMHVIMDAAGAAGKAVGTVAGAVSGAASGTIGKIGGIFGSMLKTILPGFADGGYMNGPAIVGENGPELLSATGYVTPNHKLNFGGGGDIHFHPGAIDARGSNDPAQVEAAVQRGIRAAAPHIMAGSVKANREQMKRRPSRG